jgi:hypothetical protein
MTCMKLVVTSKCSEESDTSGFKVDAAVTRRDFFDWAKKC